MKNKNWFYYALVFILWLVYAGLNFFAPQTNTNTFGLTPEQINLLKITIYIPYLGIWMAALYGSLKLRDYSQTIKGSIESKGIISISNGLGMLVVSLILPTLIGAVRTLNATNLQAISGLTIINNYMTTLIPLAAFYFIFIGSKELLQSTTNVKVDMSKKLLCLIPLVIFSIVYLWLIFTNPNRQVGVDGASATYYLPDILILLTLVIPSIAGWVLGTLGALNIWYFMKNASGLIYKKALNYCVWGIVAVISGSIIIHALLSLGSTRLLGFGIGGLLFVIYLFLAAQVLGYMLIGYGAKKLTHIETV